MKPSVFVPAAVLAAVISAAPLAFQQVPVFRSEANYVEVTARVVDRDGRFVEGLTAADFEIREDGRPERVETAFRVDLPTPWSASAAAATVLYRPALPSHLQVAQGRIYLLYLNATETRHIPITRQLARDFVRSYLQPDDVVALWSQARGLITFTSDRDRLIRGIDTFLGSDETYTEPVPRTGDVGVIEPQLTSALDWFNSVQGRRKSILLFSAGWSGIGPVFSDQAIASPQTRLVDRADVQIYAVDTRGLVAPFSSGPPSRPASAAGAALNVTTELDALSQSTNQMRWLAEDTGGFAIVNHNTYAAGFRRIVEENSQYYVLGYQTSRRQPAGWEYRDISVKVVKPGLTDLRVQARRGYVAR